MRIGVDIDGVIADVLPLWLARLNITLNKNILGEAGLSFDAAKEYGLTYEELERFYQENEVLFIENSEPVSGAVKYLALLMETHQVYLVSARNLNQVERTRIWLEKHKILYTDLVLLGSTDKRQTSTNWALELFIEDSMANATKLAAHGIPVLLLNAPYNQGALPDGVERSFSWEDIYLKIIQLNRTKLDKVSSG